MYFSKNKNFMCETEMIVQQLYDGMRYILITGIQQSSVYHLFILEML